MPAALSPRVLPIDFVAQWEDVREDALAAVDRVGRSGWLVLGDEVRSFEAELGTFWGLPHVVGCGNGLDAIEIGLRVLGLQPGEKVLTTPLSAFATTLAIVRAGGTPVFVDVDASGLIDLELCDEVLSRRRDIRFLVPVHLYGHALDHQRLTRLKRSHQLLVVEDCAQAIGARSHGQPVGSVGDVAATSFYPTKNLGALGDGGALLTADAALADAARCLRDYGQSQKYVHARIGMNSRLDEIQAAILRSALLPRLPRFTARRREIAERYRREIVHRALTLPAPPASSTSAWHLFPVVVEKDRAHLKSHLDAAGIVTGVHYPRLISDQEALAGVPFETEGALGTARRLAESELSLPLHPYLRDQEVERVIAACNTWQGGYR